MLNIKELYMLIVEGQILKTLTDEKDIAIYNRLLDINNDSFSNVDITDTMFKYWYPNYLKMFKEDLSLDKTNHLKDTLALYSKLYKSEKIPDKDITLDIEGKAITKNLNKIETFQRFDIFEKFLNMFSNSLVKNKIDDKLNKNNIEMFYVDSEYFVIGTKNYEDTLEFIYHVFRNHTSQDNGGSGAAAFKKGASPYCTAGKGHWDHYAEGNNNYTQYWVFKNKYNVSSSLMGKNLNDKDFYDFYLDFKGKASDSLYANIDSNLDILNHIDSNRIHDKPFLNSIVNILELMFITNKFIITNLTDLLDVKKMVKLLPENFTKYYDKLAEHYEKNLSFYEALMLGKTEHIDKYLNAPNIVLNNENQINNILSGMLHNQKIDIKYLKTILDKKIIKIKDFERWLLNNSYGPSILEIYKKLINFNFITPSMLENIIIKKMGNSYGTNITHEFLQLYKENFPKQYTAFIEKDKVRYSIFTGDLPLVKQLVSKDNINSLKINIKSGISTSNISVLLYSLDLLGYRNINADSLLPIIDYFIDIGADVNDSYTNTTVSNNYNYTVSIFSICIKNYDKKTKIIFNKILDKISKETILKSTENIFRYMDWIGSKIYFYEMFEILFKKGISPNLIFDYPDNIYLTMSKVLSDIKIVKLFHQYKFNFNKLNLNKFKKISKEVYDFISSVSDINKSDMDIPVINTVDSLFKDDKNYNKITEALGKKTKTLKEHILSKLLPTYYNDLNKVIFLIKNGADIHTQDEKLFRNASKFNNIDLVKYCLKNKVDVSAKNYEALLISINKKNIVCSTIIIDNSIDDISKYEEAAFKEAINKKSMVVIKYLIDKGATQILKDKNLIQYARDVYPWNTIFVDRLIKVIKEINNQE